MQQNGDMKGKHDFEKFGPVVYESLGLASYYYFKKARAPRVPSIALGVMTGIRVHMELFHK